jgi:hypothetical protein
MHHAFSITSAGIKFIEIFRFRENFLENKKNCTKFVKFRENEAIFA